MLWIKASLPVDERDTRSYIAAWTSLLKETGHVTSSEIQKSLFDHLYENLTVLDAKTGIVISLNGILIASYVFVITPVSNRVSRVDAPAFLLAAVYSTIAVVL